MKLKNLSGRNVGALAQHNAHGGLPFSIKVIAGSTLEISDEEYEKVKPAVSRLVEAGVLEIVQAPVTKLTAKEIVDKVKAEADVELKVTMGKTKLQEKAEALGVEV